MAKTKKPKYKVGQLVEIVNNTVNHFFPIGSVVEIKSMTGENSINTCRVGGVRWWVSNEDVKPTKKTKAFIAKNTSILKKRK